MVQYLIDSNEIIDFRRSFKKDWYKTSVDTVMNELNENNLFFWAVFYTLYEKHVFNGSYIELFSVVKYSEINNTTYKESATFYSFFVLFVTCLVDPGVHRYEQHNFSCDSLAVTYSSFLNRQGTENIADFLPLWFLYNLIKVNTYYISVSFVRNYNMLNL